MNNREHTNTGTMMDEASLRSVAENLHDGILVNVGGRHVYANRRMAEILGYTPDELLGTRLEDLVHPAEVALIHDRFRRRMLGEPVPVQYDTMFVSRDGRPVPVEIVASRATWRGEPAGLVSVRDIRARQTAQFQLEQLNRLLHTVSAIDAVIVRETDRARLFDEACRILVEVGGYRSAWIGMVDWPSQEIHPLAYAGALRAYVQGLRIRCDESPEGCGPAGMAVRTNRPQVINDAETDPAFAIWRDRARAAGYRSVLALPLRTGAAQVAGVVAVHAAAVNAFGGEEVELLARMSDNVGHALRVIDDEEQRARAERELRRTNALLENVFANTRVLLAQLDRELRIVRVNRAFVLARGHTAEYYAGRNFFDLYPEAERERHVRQVLDSGEPYVAYAQPFDAGRAAGANVSHWDWNVSAIRESGGVTGVVLRMVDVTDRHAAEALMRRLWSALGQTADSVVITDRNGRIEYVNAAFEAATGFARGEAIGQTPRLVKSGRHDEEFYRHLWATILAGQPYRNVVINRKRDGSLYYEEKTITPLKDEAGHITHFISTGKDITERMHAQERLQYLAYHDVLTELPNRALFMDRLEHALSRAERGLTRLALLFLDVDRFKVINDTLGHDVGDRLLQSVARRLRESVRDVDTVARVSGDEFAILLEDADRMDDLTAIARKLLEAFARPFELPQRELFVTTSIGVSVFPNDGRDALTLLKNADTAMYRAKDAGRNTYQFYSADMSARAIERLALETGLRRVLEREELVLHYQPQVDIRSGRLLAAEALLRWRHPQLGLIQPGEFIGLLEDTGMILPVGEWVMRTACAQASAWQRQGVRDLRVTVNLSARQFNAPGLADQVMRLLDDHNLRPEMLEFEITESVLMQHTPTTVEPLTRLADMGCRIAIDDFGTGYSSLAYLKRFPIHVLKIDHTFVRDVPEDPDDAAIVTTIVAMAHSLKMEVVAEGVETEKQLAFLRACGCDAMQGNLFSRPLPADALTQLVGSRTRT
jgi:diguanylate cyclase (GGDEF)-like protein/PAS domain S-box-containing protein